MIHISHLHVSPAHSLGIILGCIVVLLIINWRYRPIYHRELTVGYLLGMLVGIPLAALRLIKNKYLK